MTTSAQHVRMLLAMLLTVAALAAAGCSDSKGVADIDEPEILPDPTPIGTSTGPRVTKTIGPQGGSLTSADGGLTLTVPAGAVAAPTEFGIEPITNTMPNGLGQSYALTPNGRTFAVPVTVSLRYADDELGDVTPGLLGLGFQDTTGVWWALLSTSVDTAAGTLTISTSAFSSSRPRRSSGASVERGSLAPAAAIAGARPLEGDDIGSKWIIAEGTYYELRVLGKTMLKANEKTVLQVFLCVDVYKSVRTAAGRVTVVYERTNCNFTSGTGDWNVEGSGDFADIGSIGWRDQATSSQATYEAPSKIRKRTFVTVSVKMSWVVNGETLEKEFWRTLGLEPSCLGGLQRQSLELALATAADDVCVDEWVGSSSTTLIDAAPSYRFRADVTWKVDPALSFGGRVVYYPVGTLTFEAIDPCITITPSRWSLTKEAVAQLVVDYSSGTPTYEGQGLTLWAAKYRNVCEEGSGDLPWAAGGTWFRARGAVSTDGSAIAGTQSDAVQTYTYSFKRPEPPPPAAGKPVGSVPLIAPTSAPAPHTGQQHDRRPPRLDRGDGAA